MKKTYIIIIIVIAVAIIVLSILISYSSNKKETQTQIQDNKIESPATYIQDSTIKVENKDSSNDIKNSFGKYISQNAESFPSYEKDGISRPYAADDKNGDLIELNSFLKSIDADINPKIKNLIGTNYYGFFYCPDEKGSKDFGLTFDLGSTGDANQLQDINFDTKESMLGWEPYMLKDLHNILFPNENFSDDLLSQPLSFKDGKYRYAEIKLPGNRKSTINYVLDIFPPDNPSSENKVYIATSKECLQKSLEYLFDF